METFTSLDERRLTWTPDEGLPHHHQSFPSSETTRASSDVSASLVQPFPSFDDSAASAAVSSAAAAPGSLAELVKDAHDAPSAHAAASSVDHQRPKSHSIRRKPLSASASPIATRFSSGGYLTIASGQGIESPEQRFSRSLSVDSPTVYEFPASIETVSGLPLQRPSAKSPGLHHLVAATNGPPTEIETAALSIVSKPVAIPGDTKPPSQPASNPADPQTDQSPAASDPHSRDQDQVPAHRAAAHDNQQLVDEDPLSDHFLDGYNSDGSSYSSNPNSPNTMSLHVNRKATPPRLSLGTDQRSNDSASDSLSPDTNKPLPKSPGSSKLGSFFGWGSPSPSSAEYSDRANLSPLPSPLVFSKSNSVANASPLTTPGPSSHLTAPKAPYGSGDPREYVESYLATPSGLTTSSAAGQVEEMEEELKAISAELAASIRREMDLEDLVERLQAERDNPTSNSNKRTSDYFSDSGYSSAKFSEYDQSREEIEKIQRRSEQEKAQVRLELSDKLQEERSRRQQLDEQIRELSERASQIDLAQMNSVDASGRVRELESTCDTLRRKLSEERKAKDNFEDLLTALRDELHSASNERDNLRDEIVPQLRARVEGLEAQAAELEKMTYESTKMQQELQTLKEENTTLKQNRRVDSIAEEPSSRTRASSITGPLSAFKAAQRPSLSRSASVKTTESREQLSDRLKDVEEQRDALHRALKALLERQEHQNRENEKKMRALEMERDRLLSSSPQKAGYRKEVSNLREEINALRRRAEEAMEQKWMAEKGLGGLKMDLDRAEQEISSLRSLLREKDILIPPSLARASDSSDTAGVPVTSESLTAAYADLQNTYSDALERIKKLEAEAPKDEKTKLAIEKLEQSLASTVTDRDLARKEAATYQAQLDALKAGEKSHLSSEKALADELHESARRVEELAIQVRQQLATNDTLRQRLTDTVARGEAEQKANKERITSLQSRLRVLEDSLLAAQSASEDRVTRHEEEVAALKESHNAALARMGNRSSSSRAFPPKSPLSPMLAGKSPLLSATRDGPAMSVAEETQVETLRARVTELEKALLQADSEMEEVVGKMNTAQIEVMTLQEEREEAVRQTKRLERELQAEKVKAFDERFKTLQS